MITQDLHMAQVSDVLGIPIELLRDMNPQYRADVIPGKSQPMVLRLPLEQASRFIDQEKNIYAYKDSVFFNPEKTITSPTTTEASTATDAPPGNYAKLSYTVKNGDNLGFISTWYNVRISDIRYWNNIRHNTIRAGQKLTIYVPRSKLDRYQDINKLSFNEKQARASGKAPIPANSSSKSTEIASTSGDFITYTVKQGDTIWDIMRKYPGVTESEIKKWNNLSNTDKIQAGQRLKIIPKS
jgi:membrane-bound lytic murein transglycosylase D